MRAVAAWLVIGLAGCGGSTHVPDEWERQTGSGSSAGSTSASGTTTSVTDAGVDGGDPRRDRAMALFARSCTPCHRHVAPLDPEAVERGVYLETPTEILALARATSVGHTPSSLETIVAQRADGYDLMVGESGRTPMPPRASSYPAWTQDEAREVQAWLRAAP